MNRWYAELVVSNILQSYLVYAETNLDAEAALLGLGSHISDDNIAMVVPFDVYINLQRPRELLLHIVYT